MQKYVVFACFFFLYVQPNPNFVIIVFNKKSKKNRLFRSKMLRFLSRTQNCEDSRSIWGFFSLVQCTDLKDIHLASIHGHLSREYKAERKLILARVAYSVVRVPPCRLKWFKQVHPNRSAVKFTCMEGQKTPIWSRADAFCLEKLSWKYNKLSSRRFHVKQPRGFILNWLPFNESNTLDIRGVVVKFEAQNDTSQLVQTTFCRATSNNFIPWMLQAHSVRYYVLFPK